MEVPQELKPSSSSSCLRQRKYRPASARTKLTTNYKSTLSELLKREPEPVEERQIFDLEAFADENEKENHNNGATARRTVGSAIGMRRLHDKPRPL